MLLNIQAFDNTWHLVWKAWSSPCVSTACGFVTAPGPWCNHHRFHRWQIRSCSDWSAARAWGLPAETAAATGWAGNPTGYPCQVRVWSKCLADQCEDYCCADLCSGKILIKKDVEKNQYLTRGPMLKCFLQSLLKKTWLHFWEHVAIHKRSPLLIKSSS